MAARLPGDTMTFRLALAAAEEDRTLAKMRPATSPREPAPAYHEFGPVALSVVSKLLGPDCGDRVLVELQTEMRALALRVVRVHLEAYFCWWTQEEEHSLRRLRSRVSTVLMSLQAAVTEVAIVGSTRACIGPGGRVINLALGTAEVSRLYLPGLDAAHTAELWPALTAKAGDPLAVEEIVPDVAPRAAAISVQFKNVQFALAAQAQLAVSPMAAHHVIPYKVVPTDACTWGYGIKITFPLEHQAAQTTRILDTWRSSVLSVGEPYLNEAEAFEAAYTVCDLRTAMDIMEFVENAGIDDMTCVAQRVTAKTNQYLPWAAFQGLSEEIEHLSKMAEEEAVDLHVLKSPSGVAFLLVGVAEDDSADGLRNAHVAVTTMLAQLQQLMDSEEYTHPDDPDHAKAHLLLTRWGRIACSRYEQLRNVVLEPVLCTARLYGPAELRTHAAEGLTNLIDCLWPADEDEVHSRCKLAIIAPEGVDAGRTARSILPALEQHFGDCAIEVCAQSLLVTGPTASVERMRWEITQLIGNEFEVEEHPADEEEAAFVGEAGDEDCPICMDAQTPTNCFLLTCGHRIHLTCFLDQLEMATEEEVCCVQEACKTRIPWADIANIAQCCHKGDLIDNVSESLFAKFCERHGTSYKPCFGADCHQVRHADTAAFLCDQCNVEYCVTCSEMLAKPSPLTEHEAKETCEQVVARRRAVMASANFDITQMADIVLCPKCRAPTQKNGGCNRMTCPVCRINYCYKCMASFATADQCYKHLNAAHGGYYT